ncbi:hypothetical protein GYA27_00135 [candidate division WWE3 bacterium]|uniref:Uncharacterized protein n=1 Tax=candidate division WWE3 bacterium TaxID=2053526 RepID=A0A7X9DJL2_UNCKA|nr:hypothetical protein [candidate division WWE3 bacterium]
MKKRFTYVMVLLVVLALVALPVRFSVSIASVQAGKDECPAGQEQKDGCVLKFKYVPGQGCISKWFPAGAKAEGWSDSCLMPVVPTATAPAPVEPTATNVPATSTAEPTEKPAEPTATPARIQPTATLPAVQVNTESALVVNDGCPAKDDCLCRIASSLETQTALMATQVSLQATQVAQQAVCAVPNNSGMGLSALTDKMAPYLKDVENFLATPTGIFFAILGLAALFAAAFYFTREPAPKTPERRDKVINQ